MTQDKVICPRARSEQANATIIGVVRGGNGAVAPEILPEALPLHPLIDLVPENVRPSDVLRFAAPCAGAKCRHFSNDTYTLAARIVALLPAVMRKRSIDFSLLSNTLLRKHGRLGLWAYNGLDKHCSAIQKRRRDDLTRNTQVAPSNYTVRDRFVAIASIGEYHDRRLC